MRWLIAVARALGHRYLSPVGIVGSMKKALVCGVSGQDGAYLAQFLLERGYEVYGTSRDAQTQSFRGLKMLGIENAVQLRSMAQTDLHSAMTTIASIAPDEIYNLAGQSSVGLSFEQPVETIQSIVSGTQNLLESIRLINKSIKLYSAGSSECFGESAATPSEENSRFSPKSPYAMAKSAAFWQVAIYREAYGIRAATGILFNHESVLRASRFVTLKIVSAAKRIAEGDKTKLVLGDLDIHRDWGYSPEYVEAMWRMLQLESPIDLVISTGHTMSLRDFVSFAFEYYGLDWTQFVVQDQSLFRPNELRYSCGNPAKAKHLLGWEAKTWGRDLVFKLAADLDKVARMPQMEAEAVARGERRR